MYTTAILVHEIFLFEAFGYRVIHHLPDNFTIRYRDLHCERERLCGVEIFQIWEDSSYRYSAAKFYGTWKLTGYRIASNHWRIEVTASWPTTHHSMNWIGIYSITAIYFYRMVYCNSKIEIEKFDLFNSGATFFVFFLSARQLFWPRNNSWNILDAMELVLVLLRHACAGSRVAEGRWFVNTSCKKISFHIPVKCHFSFSLTNHLHQYRIGSMFVKDIVRSLNLFPVFVKCKT